MRYCKDCRHFRDSVPSIIGYGIAFSQCVRPREDVIFGMQVAPESARLERTPNALPPKFCGLEAMYFEPREEAATLEEDAK